MTKNKNLEEHKEPEPEDVENEDEEDEESEPIKTKQVQQITREKFPCVYCVVMCTGVGGMKRHFHYCSDNPESKKFKKK